MNSDEESKLVKVSIANDFSPFPAGRHRTDGPYSGEAFREDLLAGALRAGARLEVDLDGTEGYGSSFLEEAFGGLVRDGFSAEFLDQHLQIIGSDKILILEIKEYILEA